MPADLQHGPHPEQCAITSLPILITASWRPVSHPQPGQNDIQQAVYRLHEGLCRGGLWNYSQHRGRKLYRHTILTARSTAGKSEMNGWLMISHSLNLSIRRSGLLAILRPRACASCHSSNPY